MANRNNDDEPQEFEPATWELVAAMEALVAIFALLAMFFRFP